MIIRSFQLLPLMVLSCVAKGKECTTENCNLRPTGRSCSSGRGKLVKVGLEGSSGKWRTLIISCHSIASGEPFYVKHTLKPHEDISEDDFETRFTIGRPDLYPNVSISSLYPKQAQLRRFQELLGSHELASKLVKGRSFLARGHLAPAADFLRPGDRKLTYTYVNVAPMWQQVNAGNWKSVESTLRKFSMDRNIDLEVVTGVMGIMTAQDTNGKNKELTLGKDQVLPVPKHIWKVVYDPRTKRGIAFIALNDPFKNEIEKSDCPCKKSLCDDADWTPSSRSWSTTGRGYICCCKVSALRRQIRKLSGPVKGLLIGPNPKEFNAFAAAAA